MANVHADITNKTELSKVIKANFEGLPKEGIIQIVVKDPKKTKGLVVRSYGKRPFINEDGEQITFVLERSMKLDMVKFDDRMLYGQLVNHPYFTSAFEVVDHESEALKTYEFKELEMTANKFVMDFSDQDTMDMCRLLLIPVRKGSSIKVLKKALFDFVEEDPQKFLDVYNDSDKSYKILLKKCMDASICVKKNGRFELNGNGIGTTLEQGIEFLKLNEDIPPALRKQLKDLNKE